MNEITSFNNLQPVLANIEAEQQLLGALLLDPKTLDKVADLVRKGFFYDPVHQAIYDTCAKRIRAGQASDPTALRLWAEGQEGMADLGGPAYLARLAGSAIAPQHARTYAEMLSEVMRKRSIQAAINEAMVALADDETRADQVSSRLEAAILAQDAGRAGGPVSMTKAVTTAVSNIKDVYEGREGLGVQTGIGSLDHLLSPLRPGQVCIMAGRPSMGKSAVALSVALNVARAGGGVAICTLEMSPEDMAERALSEATARNGAAVNYTSMTRPDLPEIHMRAISDAARDVADLPIHFLPIEYRDAAALYGGVRRVAALQGGNLKLLVVDYLQIMGGDGKSTYERITNISIALKSLAMQLQIPILALSQLSRGVEQRDEKRPMLSDLRDSGQIEQDADAVLFCYRDSYYLEREEPQDGTAEEHDAWKAAMQRAHNKLEIIVAKQRKGPIGTAHVMFNPAINRVWDQ